MPMFSILVEDLLITILLHPRGISTIHSQLVEVIQEAQGELTSRSNLVILVWEDQDQGLMNRITLVKEVVLVTQEDQEVLATNSMDN